MHTFLVEQHLRSAGLVAIGSAAVAAASHLTLGDAWSDKLPGIAHYGLLLWGGANMAINWLEAPVKFQAPSLTRAIGLDVGRHVFSALNKVEVAGAAALAYATATGGLGPASKQLVPVLVGVIGLETVGVLPLLFQRAAMVIKGEPLPPSKSHLLAMAASAVKIALLISLAVKLA